MNLSDDRRARIGVRTIPKKRQIDEDKVEFFFGYKLHLDADAERKIPIAFHRTREQAR